MIYIFGNFLKHRQIYIYSSIVLKERIVNSGQIKLMVMSSQELSNSENRTKWEGQGLKSHIPLTEIFPGEDRPCSSSQGLIPEGGEQLCLLCSDLTTHTREQPKAPAEHVWEPLNKRLVSGNKKLFTNVMCESCWQTETSSQWVCVSVAWTIMHRADKAGINTNSFCVNVILLGCAKMTTSDVFTRNRRSVVRKGFLLQMGKLSHFQIPFFSNAKMRPAAVGLGAGLVVLQHRNLHPESR